MKESADDDDCLVYLLDIGQDRWRPEGNRLDYVIEGTRFVNQVAWKDNGNTMILCNNANLFDPVVISLEAHTVDK